LQGAQAVGPTHKLVATLQSIRFKVLDCIDTIQMSSSVEVGGNPMNGIDNRIKRKSKGMNLKPDIGYGGNAGRS